MGPLHDAFQQVESVQMYFSKQVVSPKHVVSSVTTTIAVFSGQRYTKNVVMLSSLYSYCSLLQKKKKKKTFLSLPNMFFGSRQLSIFLYYIKQKDVGWFDR